MCACVQFTFLCEGMFAVLRASFKPLLFFLLSLEDPPSIPEESINDPTFQESYDDVNVDHLINFQLVG